MSNLSLQGEMREINTKGYLKQIRKSGKVPAICYGADKNVNVTVDRITFEKVYHESGDHLVINLDIAGDKKRQVLVKSYEIAPLLKEIIHVDFLEISDNKIVKTNIPIKLTGVSKGAKLGGVLEHKLHKLSIRSLPKNIPSTVEVDVTEMNVGDAIYVESLKLADSVTILNKPKQAVASVAASRTTKLSEQKKGD